METLSHCPVCGQDKFTHYKKCKDYTVSQDVFSILSCNSCSFKFTNPRPISMEIGKYYASEDYISHSNSKNGLFNSLYQKVRNITISQKLKLIDKYVSRGTILDIGCGTGEFLNYCKENGWITTGIEPGDNARNYSINTYNLKVEKESAISEYPNDFYDVITMWHVLEHVHELNKRVADLFKIVKDNGIVIIAVPNYTSWDANYYSEFWAAYDLPRHLYHFSPESLNALFIKHNFNLIETKPMKFDSFYVSMLSEKYKNGKLNYFNAIINGLRSNLSAASKNNSSYSSQIYIFKKG